MANIAGKPQKKIERGSILNLCRNGWILVIALVLTFKHKHNKYLRYSIIRNAANIN